MMMRSLMFHSPLCLFLVVAVVGAAKVGVTALRARGGALSEVRPSSPSKTLEEHLPQHSMTNHRCRLLCQRSGISALPPAFVAFSGASAASRLACQRKCDEVFVRAEPSKAQKMFSRKTGANVSKLRAMPNASAALQVMTSNHLKTCGTTTLELSHKISMDFTSVHTGYLCSCLGTAVGNASPRDSGATLKIAGVSPDKELNGDNAEQILCEAVEYISHFVHAEATCDSHPDCHGMKDVCGDFMSSSHTCADAEPLAANEPITGL